MKYKKLTTFFLTILLVTSFILPWAKVDLLIGLTLRAMDIMTLCVIVLFLLALSFNPKKKLINASQPVTLMPLLFWLTILSVWPLFGFLLNGNLPVQDLTSSVRWIFMLGFSVFLLYGPVDKDMLEASLRNALFYTGILVSSICILQATAFFTSIVSFSFIQDIAPLSIKSEFTFRATGFFASPNPLGWYAAIVSILSAFYTISKDNQLTWKVILFVHLLILVMSTSRSSILATLVSLISFLIIFYWFRPKVSQRKDRKYKPYTVVVLAIAFCSLLLFSFPEVFRLSGLERALSVVQGNLDADASFDKRVSAWRHALAIGNAYAPFGYGGDPTTATGRVIDSGWVAYYVQGGVFFVVGFTAFIVTTIAFSIGAYKKSDNPTKLSIGAITLALAIGHVTMSPIHYPHVFILYVFIFSLTVARHHRRLPRQVDHDQLDTPASGA